MKLSAALLLLISSISFAQAEDRFAQLSQEVNRSANLALEQISGLPNRENTSGQSPFPTGDEASIESAIRQAIASRGMPVELLMAQVAVESGGNARALSPKGALGLWQLMPQTARRFGLKVTTEEDQRLDPMLSTRAALEYLAELYQRFGDWELVLAAYNAGEGRVQDAIRSTRSKDFAHLAHLRLLPAETRDYVPAVFARARSAAQKGR